MADNMLHGYRVLFLLREHGPLSKWELTQKCMSYLLAPERNKVLTMLKRKGYVDSFTGRRFINGEPTRRGPTSVMFELKPKGIEALSNISKQTVIKS